MKIKLLKLLGLMFLASLTNLIIAETYQYQVNPQSPYLEFKQARIDYMLTTNEKFDSDVNLENWKKIIENHPNDPLILAYLGSSKTMVGRDSYMPWNKIKYVEDGVNDMERALENLSEILNGKIGFDVNQKLEIKYLVGQTFLTLPNFIFKTESEGEAQLEQVIASPSFSKSGQVFQAMALITLAKHYATAEKKQAKVKTWVNRVLKMSQARLKDQAVARELRGNLDSNQ